MIRVLHTIDTTGPGGAETVFVNLVKGLDQQAFTSVAAIRGPGWICDTLRKNGIEPLFINSRGRFNLRHLLELVRIVRKYRIDVIQSHLLGSNLYTSMAGLICRVPVISTFHGFVDAREKERFMSFKRRLINLGSRRIVFVSDLLREHYVQTMGFSRKKSMTIYNGVDTAIFSPDKDDSVRESLDIGPENIVIGAVGNIRPAKGYDVLIRAARLISDKHPECRFVVAGQGSGKLYDELIHLRDNLGLEKVFRFIGFQDNPEKILNNLDIFVLPSTSEGFSISTIEAMACGIPAVVTRSGGPEEIVRDGISGLIVDAGDAFSLEGGISHLIDSPDVRKKITSEGRKVVEDKYSITAMLSKYHNIHTLSDYK